MSRDFGPVDTLVRMKGIAVAAAVVMGVLVLVGCGGASNSGGDTTCRDFIAMSHNDEDATVAKILKERNGRNASTGDVQRMRTTLVELCQPADKQGAKISELA